MSESDIKQTKKVKDQPHYEESLAELEEIVRHLEEDNPSLEDLIQSYEKGVKHYQKCEKLLREAELKIEMLRQPTTPDEPAQTDPFDEPS